MGLFCLWYGMCMFLYAHKLLGVNPYSWDENGVGVGCEIYKFELNASGKNRID